MAYSQADLDRLDKAIATGARRVRLGSGDSAEETEFRSLDDMLKIRKIIADTLAPLAARSVTTYAQHSRE